MVNLHQMLNNRTAEGGNDLNLDTLPYYNTVVSLMHPYIYNSEIKKKRILNVCIDIDILLLLL